MIYLRPVDPALASRHDAMNDAIERDSEVVDSHAGQYWLPEASPQLGGLRVDAINKIQLVFIASAVT